MEHSDTESSNHSHYENQETKQTWKKTSRVLLNYLASDIQKKPRSFQIGLFSIFVVVGFLSLLFNMLLSTPVVYLKLSEDEQGEADIRLVPDPSSSPQNSNNTQSETTELLNFYRIQEALANLTEVEGVAPRWILPGYVYTEESEVNTTAFLVMADTLLERNIGLGRNFNQRVLGYGEAIVTSSILRVLGLEEFQGKQLFLYMNIAKSLRQSGVTGSQNQTDEEAVRSFLNYFGVLDGIGDVTFTSEQIEENFDTGGLLVPDLTLKSEDAKDLVVESFLEVNQMELPFSIVSPVEEPKGKWPKSLGNVVFVDANYVQKQLFRAVEESLYNQLSWLGDDQVIKNVTEPLEEIDLFEYALNANIMLRDRVQIYTSSVETMKLKLTRITNKIYKNLGLGHPSRPELSLANQIESSQVMVAYLSNIFMAVLLFLGILSVLLVYSLMMGNVDEKTYELGMLRALGLKHRDLRVLLVIQAVVFSVVGFALGIYLSFVLNVAYEFVLTWFTGLPVQASLEGASIGMGILTGTLIPLASVYIPIKRALSKAITDSLDAYHRVVSDVSVKILKLKKLGLSPPCLVAAVLLSVLGFLTYYLVPLTFQLEEFELFLYLMNGVLLLTILGFAFLVQLIQPKIEKLIAKTVLSNFDQKLKKIVTKNLKGHLRRNWKTSLMFCMALSFVIFSGVSFSLQGSVAKKTLQVALGGDIYVTTTNEEGLPEASIRDWIENRYIPENTGNIQAYTFLTYNIKDMPGIDYVLFSNNCGYPSVSTSVFGVEKNYLEAVDQEFYIPTEFSESLSYPELDSGKVDLVHGLYEDGNLQSYGGKGDYYQVLTGNAPGIQRNITSSDMLPVKALIEEGVREPMSLSSNTPISFRVFYDSYNRYALFRGVIRGMAQKVPGFSFSGYRQAKNSHTALVSIPQYQQMLEAVYTNKWPESLPREPKKESLIVKTSPSLTKEDREILANGIRTFLTSEGTRILDTKTLKESAELTVVVSEMLFILVGCIAFVLAFFLLWSAFTANVEENSWEYGVLRAVGLNSNECVRLYIYEAVSITLAAALLGTVVGVVVAVLLSVQFNMLVELPFDFEFPWLMFCLMLLFAVTTSVLGSYLPAKSMEKHQIEYILKGIKL